MTIKTLAIKSDWMKSSFPMEKGWGNGYIGVPPEHPWFGKSYDDIQDVLDVHGGLTYGNNKAPLQEPDGYWWFGFDTMHLYDNEHNCSEAYVMGQIESMKRQALEAIK